MRLTEQKTKHPLSAFVDTMDLGLVHTHFFPSEVKQITLSQLMYIVINFCKAQSWAF